jgi:hypothetical protein
VLGKITHLENIFCWGYFFLIGLFIVHNHGFTELPFVNIDVMSELMTGAKVLDGARLYIDWLEINPPTVYLLRAGVNALARLLTVAPVLVDHLLCLAFAALGFRVLRRAHAGRSSENPTSLAFLFVLTNAGLSPMDFSQREHLFILLFLPHMAWRLYGSKTTSLETLHGLMLGFLSTMKPQFLAAVLATEVIARAGKTKSPWNYWPLAMGIITPAFILLALSPQSFMAFATLIRDFHLSGGYESSSISWPLSDIIWNTTIPLAVFIVVLIVSRNKSERRETLLWAVLTVLFATAAVLHHVWTPYHLIPLVATSVMGIATQLSLWNQSRKLISLVLVGCAFFSIKRTHTAWYHWHPWTVLWVKPLLATLEPSESVLMFNTHVIDRFALYYAGKEQIGRWPWNFSYPWITKLSDPVKREEKLRTWLLEKENLIKTKRPSLIIFPPSYYGGVPPPHALAVESGRLRLPGAYVKHELGSFIYYVDSTRGKFLGRLQNMGTTQW